MKILWNPDGESANGEDGETEFVCRCEGCGRLTNMVFRKRGPRGAVRKGHVVACSLACATPLVTAP